MSVRMIMRWSMKSTRNKHLKVILPWFMDLCWMLASMTAWQNWNSPSEGEHNRSHPGPEAAKQLQTITLPPTLLWKEEIVLNSLQSLLNYTTQLHSLLFFNYFLCIYHKLARLMINTFDGLKEYFKEKIQNKETSLRIKTGSDFSDGI